MLLLAFSVMLGGQHISLLDDQLQAIRQTLQPNGSGPSDPANMHRLGPLLGSTMVQRQLRLRGADVWRLFQWTRLKVIWCASSWVSESDMSSVRLGMLGRSWLRRDICMGYGRRSMGWPASGGAITPVDGHRRVSSNNNTT